MKRPTGFKGFSIMSTGEIISLIGSAMTQFGLAIWIWQKSGNATPFSILTTAFVFSSLAFSPVAGAFIDRWPRKRSLILPDLASAVITLLTLILYLYGKLSLPFLYVASFISGVFNGFQWPAYSVTISAMLKKEEYGKANGLFSLTQSGPVLIAPALAGVLLPIIKLSGIMIVDLITFLAAFGAVLWVKIPENTQIQKVTKIKNILKDSIFGFKYIYRVKPLFALLLVFLSVNFFFGAWNTLLSPMILARFNNSSVVLGTVQSAFGAGGILGGLLMTIWGGTKRKIVSLLGGIAISAVGVTFLGFAHTVPFVVILVLIISLPQVVGNAASQAIWQSIVPLKIQGRVFSARKFIAQFVSVITMALSGPLVDFYLTRKVNASPFLQAIFGTGKGGAIGLLTTVSGIMVGVVIIVAILTPTIMNVEKTNPADFAELAEE
jgi:DHA3 family macrolide efflux protein-like MFS transporter